jgi:hypothetical protein
MSLPNISELLEEEIFLKDKMTIVSHLNMMAPIRSPENYSSIIRDGRNAIVEVKNFYTRKKRESKPEFYEAKLELIDELIRNVPLFFKTDPQRIINSKALPNLLKTVTQSHCIEATIANLYVPTDILANLLSGRDVNDFLKKFQKIVEKYEITYLKSKGKRRLSPRSPPKKAQFIYAYELLCEKPNVLEKIRDTGDYTLLYKRDGVHFEVKERRIFGGQKKICDTYLRKLRGMSRRGLYWRPRFPTDTLRVLFLDVIPDYSGRIGKIQRKSYIA